MTILEQRSGKAWCGAIAAGLALVCTGLTGCSPDAAPPAPVTTYKTSLPPYPSWSNPMIGQTLSHFVTGQGTCVGVFDVVAGRYTGPRSGVTAQGWGWDVGAKKPLQHVLFVNANDIIVGAGEGGVARPDVPQARQDVTSPNVGWHGVIGVTGGKLLAIGVTARNASCNVGSYDLSLIAP